MSLSDAEEFLRRMESDPDLARQAADAHRRQLVDLAREGGLDVTEDDLAEAARAAREAPYEQLDDEALDGVVAAGPCMEQSAVNISFN